MQAAKAGLSVRPLIVTLIGYLVIIDSSLNSLGWAMDLLANHSLINRVLTPEWGAVFDGGYFWHYNELMVGPYAVGVPVHRVKKPGDLADSGLFLSSSRSRHRTVADEALGAAVADRNLLDGADRVDRLQP
jgi:hypothetical protein